MKTAVEKGLASHSSNTRAMILHTSSHWKHGIGSSMWPMAVQYAMYVYNNIPRSIITHHLVISSFDLEYQDINFKICTSGVAQCMCSIHHYRLVKDSSLGATVQKGCILWTQYDSFLRSTTGFKFDHG